MSLMKSVAVALIAVLAVLACVAVAKDGVPYEPIFHVRPPNNWINDPNGAYRDPVTGRIHIYMQYNPYSALWGNISWYHVTSDDYVHWYREDELGLLNDKWYDEWGAYSGTMMNNNYSEPVAVYTCTERENIQRQCIANPSKEDLNGKRTLNRLHKSPLNVVMSEDDIPNLVKLENFRDPTEWWEDPANPGNWLIAFVARIDDEEGDNAHVIVFTTDDPSFQSNYKFSHSIYVYKYDLDHMFECPDFFVLSDPVNTGNSAAEHFLKVSTMPSHRDYVMYGSYEMNPATNQYDFVEDADRTFTFLDYGPLYAAKSFWDPILKKRFLWGWTNEDLSDAQILAQGWSGAQNVLRGLEYDATEKKLKSFPMDEVKGLRGEKVLWKTDLPVTSAPTTVLNNNNTLYHDIVVTFTVSDPSVFSATATYTADNAPEIGVMLRATDDLSEYVKIGLAMPAGSPAATAGQAQVEGRPPIKDFVGPTAANCSAECNNLRLCESWTYYTSTSNCKLYYLTNELAASTGASSGTVREPLLMMERANSGTIGGSYTLSGRAPFAQATPNSFELRILVDDSMIEAFKDGGLETLTGRVYIDNGLDHTGIALYANNLGTATVTADIQVFTMTSMWAERPTTAVRDFTDSLYTLLSKLIDV